MKNVVLAALLGACLSAHAVDGGPFLAMCETALVKPASEPSGKTAFQAGYCIGAMDAGFDLLVLEAGATGRGPGLCPKEDGKDPLVLVKVAVKYLRANPQAHSQPSGTSIRKALLTAYPCP